MTTIPAVNAPTDLGKARLAIVVGNQVMSIPAAGMYQPLDPGLTALAGVGVPVAGDLVYSPSNGVWARLAKGTALQHLRMNAAGTMPEWATITIREVLTANRTYYVRTDGADSNSGLSNTAGGALKTIQKAWDAIISIDLGGYTATIQIGDGTYTAGAISDRSPVGGTVVINGNAATPANVIVSKTGGDCFNFSGPTRVELRNLETRTTTSGDCVAASYGAVVTIGVGMRFGACAASHMRATSGGSVQNLASAYAIVGSAPYHMFGAGGRFLMVNSTVTLTGTPSFSAAFAAIQEMSSLIAYGGTYSGAATGLRYFVSMNSMIQTYGSGASYLPGSTAGIADAGSGGRYA